MRLRREERPLRVGHRGAAALAPENTLEAIEAALALDVDLVEFDVLEAGGELVLAHGRRAAGPWAPRLDDALALLAERAPAEVGVVLDLKWWGFEEPVVEALRRHGLVERTLVSSFRAASLLAVRALEPGLATGFGYPHDRLGVHERGLPEPVIAAALRSIRRTLPHRIPGIVERAGAQAAMLHHLTISRPLVERLHARGIAVFAWTLARERDVARVVEAGVDGLVADDPRILGTALARSS